MANASNAQWFPLPDGFPAGYEISELGLVRNSRTGRVLKPMMTGPRRSGGATAKVRLQSNPRIDCSVAHLVLLRFAGDKPPGAVAMHLDDNKANNALSNLRWGTSKDNSRDAASKTRCAGQKINPLQAKEIRAQRLSGVSGRAVAAAFGISEQRVCDIFKGRTSLC